MRRGFTLIEVVVALLILSTAVIVLSGLSASSLRQTAETRDQRAAWELAALAMGQVVTEESAEWGDEGGSSRLWAPPEGMERMTAAGFRVEYSVQTEEVRLSEREDAVPQKVQKVVVRVIPPADRTEGWAAAPVELVMYHPYRKRS